MSLSGCSIALSGKFPGYTQAKLKALINSNGAKFEARGVTSTTTHLITQQPEFDKPSQKLSDAWAKDIPTVSLDWLLNSVKGSKRFDESNYSYKPSSSQLDSAQMDGKKRKKVEPETESEDLQDQYAKRQRGESVEKSVEEKTRRGRGRPKTVKARALEKENVIKEPRETGKGGRPATQADPKDEDITAMDPGSVNDQKGLPEKRRRPAKKTAGLEPGTGSEEDLAGDTLPEAIKIAKVKDIETPKKRPIKVARDLTLGEKQGILTTKSKGAVKAKVAAKKKSVPVDVSCPLTATHHVYIDPSGAVFDATLNKTDIGRNNNKFYCVQLLESNADTAYATWTHWGRVGESGQNTLFNNQTLESAREIFEKKFEDKSGLNWANRHNVPKAGKYTLIENNYMDDDDEEKVEEFGAEGKKDIDKPESKLIQKSKLSPELQSLMRLIFNVDHMTSSMESMRYDANKLPLGKLSRKTLSQGFAALKDLGEIIISPGLAQSKYGRPLQDVLGDFTSKYYTVIPHSFGRMRPPIIGSEAALKKEIELVETLGDMEIASEIMKDAKCLVDVDGKPINPLDSQFKSLDLEEAAVVDKSTTEFAELEAYLYKSQKHLRRCKLVDIFRITRPDEAKRFEEDGFSAEKISTHGVEDARKLLWHGSRATNFGGILSQGLRIAPPEAPVNGYAFGKGIYLADLASKSFEYLYEYTSSNQGLLMLCEAQLGDPVYGRYDHDSNAANNSRRQGALSTWAQGKTQPVKWKDAGVISEELKGVLMPDVNEGLINPQNMPPSAWIPDNEYIVYSSSQVKIRYLFRIDFSL